MAENIMKTEVSFQSLAGLISSLGNADKHKLWELLEAELFADDTLSPEDMADIATARAEYEAGDYITFDQYQAQRAIRSV